MIKQLRFPHFLAAALAILFARSPLAAETAARPSDTRPNLVIIFADDLGYSDLGCYGSEIKTPHIDRLAAQGVRFRQFYNNGRCCPSRASILTGKYPGQVGVASMIDGYAKWIRDAANRPSYDDHLRRETPTIAERLRSAGYRTMMSGKWHLGERPNEWPVARGFDRSFALIPGAMNYFGGESTGPRAPLVLDDERFVPPVNGFFSTDAFTDRAIEFMSEAESREQPFFLYLAYNAPHWPLQAPPEDIEKYDGVYDKGWQRTRRSRRRKMDRLGVVERRMLMADMDRGEVRPWEQLSPEKRDEWARRMEIYSAQVTRMDENIGRVLDQLETSGAAENTIVLFLSDNGGAAEDPHRGRVDAVLGSRDSFWGYSRPWASVSNTPWRNHKVTMYEGGISTPAVVRWPAGQPKEARGQFVDGPAHLIDVTPTFLKLAGAKLDSGESTQLEGRNIETMLRGSSMPADRTLCWEHEGNRAILQGTWKLVELAGSPNGWELYDLAADRAEQHNLALEHPEVVETLTSAYNQWAERCGVLPWAVIQANRKDR
jgi:arylsulfatase A-like enzyme